jgi:hypothetical protein
MANHKQIAAAEFYLKKAAECALLAAHVGFYNMIAAARFDECVVYNFRQAAKELGFTVSENAASKPEAPEAGAQSVVELLEVIGMIKEHPCITVGLRFFIEEDDRINRARALLGGKISPNSPNPGAAQSEAPEAEDRAAPSSHYGFTIERP